MSPDRRQESRRPVALRAFAGPVNGGLAEAQICDLSYDGCTVKGVKAAQPGELLELRVHRLGTVEAEVRWFEGDRAGCRFLTA